MLKGCKVHWNRSCQRVAARVATSTKEKYIFLKICYMIPTLSSAIEVMACFETLCGVRLVSDLVKKVPKLQLSSGQVEFADKKCDWNAHRNGQLL